MIESPKIKPSTAKSKRKSVVIVESTTIPKAIAVIFKANNIMGSKTGNASMVISVELPDAEALSADRKLKPPLKPNATKHKLIKNKGTLITGKLPKTLNTR